MEVNYNRSTQKSVKRLQSTRVTEWTLLSVKETRVLSLHPFCISLCLAHVTAKGQLHPANECAVTLRRKGNLVTGSCPGTFWKPRDCGRLRAICSFKPEAIHCHFLLPRGVSIRHAFGTVSSFPWNVVGCRVTEGQAVASAFKAAGSPVRLEEPRYWWKGPRETGSVSLESKKSVGQGDMNGTRSRYLGFSRLLPLAT